MRSAVMLSVILLLLQVAIIFGAGPVSEHAYQDLAGEWKGTINGTVQGCPRFEGRVNEISLVLQIAEDGKFTAMPDRSLFTVLAVSSHEAIIGQVDNTLKITAAQLVTIKGDETEREEVLTWAGRIKRAKKKLTLSMTASVRAYRSPTRVCMLHGTFKLSKPR